MGEQDGRERGSFGFSTRAVHAGQDPDAATGAVVTPISLSTTFAQDGVGIHKGFEYSRSGNPTRTALEAQVASLELARHGLAFASGLAAEDNVLALLGVGQRVILGNDAYGGTFRLISKVWAPRGIEWSAFDLTDVDALDAAWPDDAAMVWLETPTNPLLTCFDIEAIAAVAHDHGALVVVDNTFATPYLQQPIPLGADVVVHSATKYLGGHSDVVGGFLAVDDDGLAERLRFSQNAAGAIPSPFDCYLVLRGVKTLAIRMERHCQNARAIVDLLVEHPAVERVLYPQLPDHPGHAAAARADARLRRHGRRSPLRDGQRRRTPGRCGDLGVHPGRVARRRRVADRTSRRHDPRIGGRVAARGARQPDPAVGRDRGRGRPGRRSRRCARTRRADGLIAVSAVRPIVVAANRLPVMRSDHGWTPSPGGLVRALYPLLRASGGTWVGWTGDPDDAPDPFVVDGVTLHPVPISAREVELYYEGFSNDGLWPLYHDALRDSTYDVDQWDAYRAVNQRFAVRLANIAPPDAIVWIHDYQLQLVPAMLREQRPDLTIGFFLHIPFPPLELFARLPWRNEIITGLLGCDLVGFQRPMGAANFATCAEQWLGLTEHDGGIDQAGHRTALGVFPIGIDVDEVEEIAAGRATRQRSSRIRTRLGDPEVVLLGVDRLDYTKGIGLRLRAFAALLEAGRLDPERHVMVQVATPTREAVEHYQDERREIERLVGEINGRFSRIGLPVIHYLYQTLGFDELIALYRAGDVMLVTPFRDGMNLVAKEYAAAKIDGDGVLVLSEFAGAADELTDAVLVNPHDDQALQDAIVTAVEMHRHERRDRMAALRAQVTKSDVQGWANSFLTALEGWDSPERVADGSPAAGARSCSGSTSTASWRRSSVMQPMRNSSPARSNCSNGWPS